MEYDTAVINIYDETAKYILRQIENKDKIKISSTKLSHIMGVPYILSKKDFKKIFTALRLKYRIARRYNSGKTLYIVYKPEGWTPPPLDGNLPPKYVFTKKIGKVIADVCDYIVLTSNSEAIYMSQFKRMVIEALKKRFSEIAKKRIYLYSDTVSEAIDRCLNSMLGEGLIKKIKDNIIYL